MKNEGEPQQAVLFFDKSGVSREMFYPEFEAILDRVVPMTQYANLKPRAVFLRIDNSLRVTAAVFFRIEFDHEGYPDSRWAIPLEQLAEDSPKGPDLGAGPITLACRSQCCIPWQRNNLWDPDMTPGRNTFVLIKKTIKNNRLGIKCWEEPETNSAQGFSQHASPPPVLMPNVSTALKRKYQQELRLRVARLLKEQRLRISTIKSNHKNDLYKIKSGYQHRVDTLKEELETKGDQLALQEKKVAELRMMSKSQEQKIDGLREYFEHKLQSLKKGEVDHLHALKDHYQLELDARIEKATNELRDQVQVRDLELMYRGERETNLTEEISRLKGENQQLLSNSGDQLLKKLTDKGINFVAYHPGAGHVTVPLEDLRVYLQDPHTVVAKHCGVSTARYKDWLQHYRWPKCQALEENGEVCNCPVDRVESPMDFHPGESDRCLNHQVNITHKFPMVRT